MTLDPEWLKTLTTEQQFEIQKARLAMRGADCKQLTRLVMQWMVQSYTLQNMLTDEMRQAVEEAANNESS